MEKIFGVPILIAIGLGLLFPYVAFELVPFGAVFLILLMYFAGVVVEWDQLKLRVAASPEVAAGIFFLFVFFPVCQWLLADRLIDDRQYLYGLVLASLCPVAIVAPFFVGSARADTGLSFALVVVSMLVFPFVAPAMLDWLIGTDVYFDNKPIARYMFLLTTLPVLAGFLTHRYARTFTGAVKRRAGVANMLCLSLLIFILFGNAARQINVHYVSHQDIAWMLLLVFVQNFVVLLVARAIFVPVFGGEKGHSLSISLSIKNYAIAAGILLFYDPKASIAPALGFVAHAVLFNVLYLARNSRYFRGSEVF